VDAPRSSPTIALLTLARAAEVEVSRILEPAGLSVRKLGILQRLSAVPGASPADLARAVGVSTEDAAPMVRALTAAGLVRRGRDGALTLSAEGAAVLDRVDAALGALDARMFEGRAALSAELLSAVTPSLGEPQD
jgi:DNA-binding MarR family transcriptional regulator